MYSIFNVPMLLWTSHCNIPGTQILKTVSFFMFVSTVTRQGEMAAKWDRCSTKRQENAIGREMFPSGKKKMILYYL